MKILIVDVRQTKHQNLALLKIQRWCMLHDFDFKLVTGIQKLDGYVPDIIYFSWIFSYQYRKLKKAILHYREVYPTSQIKIGGPAATYNKQILQDELPFLAVHEYECADFENLVPFYGNSENIVTYATKGCNHTECKYCIIPDFEGSIRLNPVLMKSIKTGFDEILNPNKIILYDSNLSGVSFKQFDRIVSILHETNLLIDVYGLHASQLTDRKAKSLSKLKFMGQGAKAANGYLRFSFDLIDDYKYLDNAVSLCVKHEVQAKIFCYLLYNFKDSPSDFYLRLKLAEQIASKYGVYIYLYPQMYTPITCLDRNTHIGQKWTRNELDAYLKMIRWHHSFLAVGGSNSMLEMLGVDFQSFHTKLITKYETHGWYNLRN